MATGSGSGAEGSAGAASGSGAGSGDLVIASTMGTEQILARCASPARGSSVADLRDRLAGRNVSMSPDERTASSERLSPPSSRPRPRPPRRPRRRRRALRSSDSALHLPPPRRSRGRHSRPRARLGIAGRTALFGIAVRPDPCRSRPRRDGDGDGDGHVHRLPVLVSTFRARGAGFLGGFRSSSSASISTSPLRLVDFRQADGVDLDAGGGRLVLEAQGRLAAVDGVVRGAGERLVGHDGDRRRRTASRARAGERASG